MEENPVKKLCDKHNETEACAFIVDIANYGFLCVCPLLHYLSFKGLPWEYCKIYSQKKDAT
jgi:hypothetical protein